MTRLPELTVLRDRYVPSPESDSADEGLPADAVASVPFGFAVETDWPTDAHCTQYECVTINGVSIRLASGALAEGVLVRMAWLIGDVDGPDHVATPEWREETEPKLEASGLAWYSTSGGYRVIAALDEPVTLRTPDDAADWTARYHGWCEQLLEQHGLELDTSACDWTRLFRLPRVRRDGKPTVADLRGEPPALPMPEPSATAPATRSAAADAGDVDARAAALAERLPPSVSGHGGDRALFTAAGELATVLDSPEAVHAVLADVFNPRCRPPWPDSKLRREARAAVERVGALGGVGKWAKRVAERAAEREPSEPECIEGLPLQTDNKGRPLPILRNVAIALDSWFGEALWLDAMSGRVQCHRAEELLQCADGTWGDRHTTALHGLLQVAGIRVSRPDTRHAIELHAGQYARNPLGEALKALRWDGVARVDTALQRYWGCESTAAVRASSRVSMLSLVARGLEPGTKVDTCLVLVGQQGAGKSTSLRALALRDEWFGDSDLPLGDKDARQLLRGKWIWELQELASLHKREAEQVKAFISQTYDTFRAAYKENVEDVPRTCVLFGTANRVDILQDPTGNRRFLPVVTGEIAIDALQADRDQLLAEAVARVLSGEQHWPTAEERAVLADAAKNFEESDPWEESIARWLLAKPERVQAGFTTAEVLSFSGGAIPLEDARQGAREARRLAGILHRLGFTRRRVRRLGRREYCWLPHGVKTSSTPDAPRRTEHPN